MNIAKPSDRAKGRIRKVHSYTLSPVDIIRLHALVERTGSSRSRIVSDAIQALYRRIIDGVQP